MLDAPQPLKGFQLWLAENRDSILSADQSLDECDVNAKGLEAWKQLSKEEKETYKTPRTPVVNGGNKRKRDEDSSVVSSSKRKLAQFAATE